MAAGRWRKVYFGKMSAPPNIPPSAIEGRSPTWEVALYYPDQGEWTESDYLRFDGAERGLELANGFLEVLPTPTEKHQEIVLFILDVLRAFVTPRKLGKVLFAGLRVKVEADHIREPDIVFMSAEHSSRRSEEYWEGADLVMEVVSADDPRRDYVTKREAYARAGIAEYWIVDPAKQAITVLALDGAAYRELGAFRTGEAAASALLPGFVMDVSACMAAGA